MKKWLILGAVSAAACLGLAGCGTDPVPDTNALQSQIADLQNQLNSMQSGGETSSVPAPLESQLPPAPSAAGSVPVQAVVSSPDSSTPSSAAGYDLTDLTNATSQMVEKMNNAQPPETLADRRTQFYALKQEMKDVEYRIDQMDDQAEMDYHAGKMTYQDYKNLEYQLDSLDNQLDTAENSLEFRFGVDD